MARTWDAGVLVKPGAAKQREHTHQAGTNNERYLGKRFWFLPLGRRAWVMRLPSFGVAYQLGIEGHKIWLHLHVRHFVLPQGKHRRKVPGARVIRALVIVGPSR